MCDDNTGFCFISSGRCWLADLPPLEGKCDNSSRLVWAVVVTCLCVVSCFAGSACVRGSVSRVCVWVGVCFGRQQTAAMPHRGGQHAVGDATTAPLRSPSTLASVCSDIVTIATNSALKPKATGVFELLCFCMCACWRVIACFGR